MYRSAAALCSVAECFLQMDYTRWCCPACVHDDTGHCTTCCCGQILKVQGVRREHCLRRWAGSLLTWQLSCVRYGDRYSLKLEIGGRFSQQGLAKSWGILGRRASTSTTRSLKVSSFWLQASSMLGKARSGLEPTAALST